MNGETIASQLKKGVLASTGNRSRLLLTLSISILSFVLIALFSSTGYSIQMFTAGIQYWIPAIIRRVNGLFITGGFIGISVNLLYSALIGVTLTNFLIQIRISGASLTNLSGIAPGFLAAGCAGCGLSLLGLIGVSGGIAALPFQGNLIKATGFVLLLFFIAKTGDPETCSILSS